MNLLHKMNKFKNKLKIRKENTYNLLMVFFKKIQKHVLANFEISKSLQQGFRINDQYIKMWCIPIN